jgi:hypothetical protein
MKPNQLPALLAIVMLASCGSGGGNKSSQGVTGEPTPSVPVQAAKMALSIIIPKAIADEAPAGTTYAVKVTGKSITATRKFPANESALKIDGFEPGDYTIELTATNGEAIIALGSAVSTITSDKPVTSVQVPLKYLRGSLLLEPVATAGHPTMELMRGKYTATARMNGCIKNDFTGAFGATSADLTIDGSGTEAELLAEIFSELKIKFNLTLADGENYLTGSGKFQSSDFTSGTIAADKIVQTEEGSIFLSLKLVSDCETSIDITGFKVRR